MVLKLAKFSEKSLDDTEHTFISMSCAGGAFKDQRKLDFSGLVE